MPQDDWLQDPKARHKRPDPKRSLEKHSVRKRTQPLDTTIIEISMNISITIEVVPIQGRRWTMHSLRSVHHPIMYDSTVRQKNTASRGKRHILLWRVHVSIKKPTRCLCHSWWDRQIRHKHNFDGQGEFNKHFPLNIQQTRGLFLRVWDKTRKCSR